VKSRRIGRQQPAARVMAVSLVVASALPVRADEATPQAADPDQPSLQEHLGARPPSPSQPLPARRHTARRAMRPPSIDGRLDEAEWRQAEPDGRFVQRSPKEGVAPSEHTEFRVLYDDEALYIAVLCRDREPQAVVGRLSRRDRETDADKIEVNISSANDGLSAYQFGVNAAGVQRHGL
jgi:hypothetical protein